MKKWWENLLIEETQKINEINNYLCSCSWSICLSLSHRLNVKTLKIRVEMTVQVIRKNNQKSETERSANTRFYLFYIHYLIILILSFGFTIIYVKNSLQKCEVNRDEIQKIANEIFDAKFTPRKNHFDRKSFQYLDENQENDISRKRVKKEIHKDEHKGWPTYFHSLPTAHW